MNPRWLLLMKRWVQNPPSPAKLKLVAAVLAICLMFWGIEQVWGWPAWLTVNKIKP
jgi:hypothetical protein